jgi:hypothetical protein
MGIDSLGMGTAQRQGLRKNSAFDGKRQKIIQNYRLGAGIEGGFDLSCFVEALWIQLGQSLLKKYASNLKKKRDKLIFMYFSSVKTA